MRAGHVRRGRVRTIRADRRRGRDMAGSAGAWNAPALGSRLSALGSRLSALGSRLSALGSRLSALGSRLSALGSRLSALGSRLLLTVRPSAPADRGLASGTGPAANPPVAASCRRWDAGGACNCSMGVSHIHCRPPVPQAAARVCARLPALAAQTGRRFATPRPSCGAVIAAPAQNRRCKSRQFFAAVVSILTVILRIQHEHFAN